MISVSALPGPCNSDADCPAASDKPELTKCCQIDGIHLGCCKPLWVEAQQIKFRTNWPGWWCCVSRQLCSGASATFAEGTRFNSAGRLAFFPFLPKLHFPFSFLSPFPSILRLTSSREFLVLFVCTVFSSWSRTASCHSKASAAWTWCGSWPHVPVRWSCVSTTAPIRTWRTSTARIVMLAVRLCILPTHATSTLDRAPFIARKHATVCVCMILVQTLWKELWWS